MTFKSMPFKRRSVIQGLGSGAVLLPVLLRSILHEQEGLAAGTAGMRLVIFPMQFGWGLRSEISQFDRDPFKDRYPNKTRVGGSDTSIVLPSYFEPLNALAKKTTIVDGVLGTYWANAHDVSYSDILTSAVRPGDDSSRVQGVNGPFPQPTGPSIDHIIAKSLQTNVLRLNANYRSFGAQCHPLCFDDNGTHLFQQDDPLTKYNEIMGLWPTGGVQNPSPQPTAPSFDFSLEKKRALLDYIRGDINLVRGRVSSDVRQRLDIHLAALDEAGQGIMKPGGGGGGMTPPAAQCARPSAPSGGNDTAMRLAGHMSLVKAGLACGTHRVAVVGIGDAGWNFQWTDSLDGKVKNGNIFSSNFHEDVSHWDSKGADSPRRRLCLEGWYRTVLEKVVAFAQSLDQMSIPGENATLLDKTMIVLTGEIGSGDHYNKAKPMVIIGGGASIRTGRYIPISMYESDKIDVAGYGSFTLFGRNKVSTRTEADFWVGVARAMGVNIDRLGISVRNTQPIILT